MTSQQTEYAQEHTREMTALVLMVDAMQRGNHDDALVWAKRMEAATDAKMLLLTKGLKVGDADSARASAEVSFELDHPGKYHEARSFMYALKARMGR